MRERTDIGSLRIVPMDATHVTGDGNDGTTTILHKAIAMANGINRASIAAERSMRRHRLIKAVIYWTIIVVVSAWAASVMTRYY